MKGSRVLPCVTSVAGSLPLPGDLAAVGACSSHNLPPPRYTPRGCHHAGLVRETQPAPNSCGLGVPGGTGDSGAPAQPCSLLPVPAELRAAALTTLSSDAAPCLLHGQSHLPCPWPTAIPLCQGQAPSFSYMWDELWQVSAVGLCS